MNLNNLDKQIKPAPLAGKVKAIVRPARIPLFKFVKNPTPTEDSDYGRLIAAVKKQQS